MKPTEGNVRLNHCLCPCTEGQKQNGVCWPPETMLNLSISCDEGHHGTTIVPKIRNLSHFLRLKAIELKNARKSNGVITLR